MVTLAMSPTEINRRLALAIGYAPKDVRVAPPGTVYVRRLIGFSSSLCISCHGWDEFDYMDWNTIGPIMERYRMFPQDDRGDWVATKSAASGVNLVHVWNTCPRTCAALAVIEAHARGLL